MKIYQNVFWTAQSHGVGLFWAFIYFCSYEFCTVRLLPICVVFPPSPQAENKWGNAERKRFLVTGQHFAWEQTTTDGKIGWIFKWIKNWRLTFGFSVVCFFEEVELFFAIKVPSCLTSYFLSRLEKLIRLSWLKISEIVNNTAHRPLEFQFVLIFASFRSRNLMWIINTSNTLRPQHKCYFHIFTVIRNYSQDLGKRMPRSNNVVVFWDLYLLSFPWVL